MYKTDPVVESLKVLSCSKNWSFPTSSEVIVAQKPKLLGVIIVDSRVLQWLATERFWAPISCVLFPVGSSRWLEACLRRRCVCWEVSSLLLEGSRDRHPPEKQGKDWPIVAIFVLFISYSRNNSINSKNRGYKWICGTQITRVIFFILGGGGCNIWTPTPTTGITSRRRNRIFPGDWKSCRTPPKSQTNKNMCRKMSFWHLSVLNLNPLVEKHFLIKQHWDDRKTTQRAGPIRVQRWQKVLQFWQWRDEGHFQDWAG